MTVSSDSSAFKVKSISVLIPTYEMGVIGANMLFRALRSIENQINLGSLSVEVVVCDHSLDDSVFHVAKNFSGSTAFRLIYIRNYKDRGSISANLNRAFEESRGQIIKILFQDDFFLGKDSLFKIISAFENSGTSWLACGSTHSSDGQVFTQDLIPRFNSQIHLAKNTMSSPSVIALRRKNWLNFDRNIIWLMDVDFYKRMALLNGSPTIIPDILIVNGVGAHQVTHTRVTRYRKMFELVYVFVKHLGQNS